MLKDSSLQIINTLTDPLVSESEYSGTATGYADGVATLSTAGVSTNTIIANGAFSGRWPVIVDGQAYPKFGQSHTITLSQSALTATINRVINQPIDYSLVVLVSPVINDLTYPTALFDITPVTGDQVLYVTADCTMSPDGGLVTSDPKSTIIVHRVEATGICYTYKFIINSAKALSVVDNGVAENENLNEKIDHVASNDNQLERPSLHDASVKSIQINYTASRRQLPEATSHEDHLNRQPLISALAAVLAHKANYEHQTIGLLGDWGIGKSTWLKLLKKELLAEHKEQEYLFGEFNAWAYEHTDNLQAGIAQEVIKALSSPAPRLEDFVPASAEHNKENPFVYFMRWLGWKRDRLFLTFKFAWRLNCWGMVKAIFLLALSVSPVLFGIPELLSNFLASKAAAQDQSLYRGAAFVSNALWFLGFGFYGIKELPKLFANPLAKELLTYLRLPDYALHLGAIPVMRKNIETLCNVRLKSDSGKPSRLLFVVDDLDRCGHDGIVKVFEAVRLVLDIKNVTVIIAVDQHIALAALALHYEEVAKHHKLGDPRAIARDYLAKVIHLPIILANPMGADIESYLQKLWLSSTSKEHQAIIEQEQLDYTRQLAQELQNIESDKEIVASNSKGNTEAKSLNDAGVEVANGIDVASDSVLSPENPKESISSPITPEDIQHPEVASLSAAQRRAFVYWLDYFGLTNPRQVKRLNNTYNLLLNCYRDVDNLTVATDLPKPMPQVLFPMMMALVIMEYLNSMDDQALRNQLRSRLLIRSSDGEDAAQRSAPLTNEFISAFHLLLEARNGLVEKVRPFVLPAIENVD